MRVQALVLGEDLDVPVHAAKGILRIGNDAALLDEGIHAQGREEPGRAVGRQDVVGSRVVIAQGLRRVAAQENGARVADFGHDLEGILRDDLQVLGGDGIGRLDELVQGLSHENIAVILDGLADDISPGKLFDEAVDLLRDPVRQGLVRREQDGAGHGVVLRLGQEVRRDVSGVRRVVCQDQDLTGSRDRVDAGHAEAGLFGQGDKNIAGAGDLVDAGNGLCAVGKGRDGLGPAHLVDLIRAGDVRCDQGARGGFSIRAGGRRDHDPFHARHFGRNHVHQDTGRIGRPSARHIAAGGSDRRHLLTQDGPLLRGRDPALGHLFLVVGADIGRCPADDLDEFGRQGRVGLLDLLTAHPDRVLGQDAVVEFLLQGKDRLVPPRADVIDDLPHGLFIFGIAGRTPSQQGLQSLAAGVLGQFHNSHTGHDRSFPPPGAAAVKVLQVYVQV